MSLFSRIRLQSNHFTPAQEKIVQYLQEHAQETLLIPINELAARCQVGDATVIRFYRSLGYESYPTFRIALTKELSESELHPIYEDVKNQDELPEVIRKVIDSSIQGISDLEQQIFLPALEEIAENFKNPSFMSLV